jgi:hypothetical protein
MHMRLHFRRKRLLGRSRCRQRYNIKIGVAEIGREFVYWILLA